MGEIIAIYVIGAVAFMGAAWGVISQRSITRRQVTLEHISRQESDGDLLKANRTFLTLSRAPGALAGYADKEKQETEEAQAIRVILNEYELIAIGIQGGVIDFRMYRRWYASGLVHCWDCCAPYVHVLRTRMNNPKIYYELEQMVGWMKGESRPKRGKWHGLFF